PEMRSIALLILLAGGLIPFYFKCDLCAIRLTHGGLPFFSGAELFVSIVAGFATMLIQLFHKDKAMSAFLAFVLLLCVMAATAEHELMHNMSCLAISSINAAIFCRNLLHKLKNTCTSIKKLSKKQQ
ncbi:hypothetical protein PRIPAC_84390, partial [Pristionchus pacificus]